MKGIFFCTLTILAFSHCQTPQQDKPERTVVDCYVRLDQAEGRIVAEATLSQGEPTPKPAEAKGGITFQRIKMDLLKQRGLSYRASYPAAYTRDLLFEWQMKEKGKKQSVQLRMDETKNFRMNNNGIVHLDSVSTLTWEGAPLERGETLVLMWEKLDRRSTVPMELYQSGSEPRVEFPAAKMRELEPGKWSLYLVRRRLIKSNIDGVEATGVTEYFSQMDTIEVRAGKRK